MTLKSMIFTSQLASERDLTTFADATELLKLDPGDVDSR